MFTWLVGFGSRPPAFLSFRSSKLFIITTVSVAIFTDIFVYGIVVPVLPFALTTRSGIDEKSVQTWISIFLAVYGAGLLFASPIIGWLADRISSRRPPLLIGLVTLAGSTAMLCAGSGMTLLVVGRLLQGASAAVVWVVGLALLVDTVGAAGAGEVMGYVGSSMSLGLLVAPLLGGVVFDMAGYYAVFGMAFGLIGVDAVLRLVLIEKKVAARWLPDQQVQEQQVHGQIQEEPAHDSAKVEPANANETTEVSGPSKMSHRIPSIIYLLSSRRLLSALWGCLIQASLMTAFDSILPIFVRDTFHWNSLGAGLIFLPLVATSFLGPIIGHWIDKKGPRLFATAGFLATCPFIILLRLVHHNTLHQKVLLCALLALIGLALTLIITPMMAEITYAVDAKAKSRPAGFFGKNGAYAQGYSLFNMAFAGGCVFGPLLAGLVKSKAGWSVTTLMLGLVSAATVPSTVFWTGGQLGKKEKEKSPV
ncbi:MFS general substrate transporter [Piedraia hortae CBS 480.64]|uniref:MFS general substrate transporter n=1 Tax=Piedraia hortae CBS 480.64 TaxID=1314780 RepID=A0A6A7BS94_9PEZI|nr:MFS general substrate transporter [Piedraia hortae CBS 480.64]